MSADTPTTTGLTDAESLYDDVARSLFGYSPETEAKFPVHWRPSRGLGPTARATVDATLAVLAARQVPADQDALAQLGDLLARWSSYEARTRLSGRGGRSPLHKMDRREANVWMVAQEELRAVLGGEGR